MSDATRVLPVVTDAAAPPTSPAATPEVEQPWRPSRGGWAARGVVWTLLILGWIEMGWDLGKDGPLTYDPLR